MTYDLSDTLSDGYEGMGPVISNILQLGRMKPVWGGRTQVEINSTGC